MGIRIAESEFRFMSILWDNEPVKSMDLVKLCEEKLGWKKSTTFTVIKNLSLKGVVKNEKSIVTALMDREDAQKTESEAFLNRTFNGSVPDMFAAFLQDRKLKPEEIDRIKKMIED